MWLGPPKSPAAARRIDLPPFLCELLEEVMDGHQHDQVLKIPSPDIWPELGKRCGRYWD